MLTTMPIKVLQFMVFNNFKLTLVISEQEVFLTLLPTNIPLLTLEDSQETDIPLSLLVNSAGSQMKLPKPRLLLQLLLLKLKLLKQHLSKKLRTILLQLKLPLRLFHNTSRTDLLLILPKLRLLLLSLLISLKLKLSRSLLLLPLPPKLKDPNLLTSFLMILKLKVTFSLMKPRLRFLLSPSRSDKMSATRSEKPNKVLMPFLTPKRMSSLDQSLSTLNLKVITSPKKDKRKLLPLLLSLKLKLKARSIKSMASLTISSMITDQHTFLSECSEFI